MKSQIITQSKGEGERAAQRIRTEPIAIITIIITMITIIMKGIIIIVGMDMEIAITTGVNNNQH
jgi:hypothetical protein